MNREELIEKLGASLAPVYVELRRLADDNDLLREAMDLAHAEIMVGDYETAVRIIERALSR